MKFKSFALGGAAIVGLALAVVPADAYTHHPSTPAEQAQTNDLNAQSLSQAQGQSTQQAQAQPSQQTASADATAASPSAGDTQSSAAGQMTNTSGTPSGTVSLTALTNPPQTLANASVETSNGQAVGAVQKVVTGTDGKAQAIDVALLGAQSKIVSIDATQLAYDQSRNVVVAQLSADQIQALPAAPQG
jgi:hypothetical protein